MARSARLRYLRPPRARRERDCRILRRDRAWPHDRRSTEGNLKLEDSQASAAIGQIALASEWSRALAEHGIVAGQVLLTLQDTEERRRYLNARATLARLFKMRAIPIINENDTVATSEIRYGDNVVSPHGSPP